MVSGSKNLENFLQLQVVAKENYNINFLRVTVVTCFCDILFNCMN